MYDIFYAAGRRQDTSEGVSKAFLPYYEKLLIRDARTRRQVDVQLIRDDPESMQII